MLVIEKGALTTQMGIALRVLIAVLFVVFLVCVLKLVSRDKLLLKYSLLWLLLFAIGLVGALLPEVVYWISGLTGFISPSNFIFLISIVLLLAISLSLSVAVSRATIAIKNLTQRVAILEKELRDGRSESD